MAFPSVINSTAFTFNSDVANHSCTIPGGWTILDKDVLVFVCALDGTTAFDDETGYTKIRSDVSGVAKALHIRRCDGSEAGTSVSFSTSGTSEQGMMLLFHVRGTFDDATITNIVEAGTWVQLLNTASNPNPTATLSPSWGAGDTLWIVAIVGYTAAAQDITAAPSGFSGLIGGGATGGANSAEVWGASRQENASSQTPAAWTGSGAATDDWFEIVIGIRAAAPTVPRKMESYRRRRAA